MLDIASHQKSLNYKPGDEWSYTNTGYNLLAILVQRVSGKSLAQFTHDNIFVPLDMQSTSWRDDFQRIVPNRAIAYEIRDQTGLALYVEFRGRTWHFDERGFPVASLLPTLSPTDLQREDGIHKPAERIISYYHISIRAGCSVVLTSGAHSLRDTDWVFLGFSLFTNRSADDFLIFV